MHTCRRKLKRLQTAPLVARLERLESEFNEACVVAKSNYVAHLVNSFSSSPQKLYRHIANLSKPKSPIGVFVDRGVPVINLSDKVKILNDFFHSTFSVSDFELPSMEDLPTPTLKLDQIDIDAADVFEALRCLDPTKTVGCDGISPYFLRSCVTALVDPITHLFNASLITGMFPKEWKIHKVTPVPKKGDWSNPSNYRPISLLCQSYGINSL